MVNALLRLMCKKNIINWIWFKTSNNIYLYDFLLFFVMSNSRYIRYFDKMTDKLYLVANS